MSGANGTVVSSKGVSTLVRPKFGPGMLLQHEDLDQLSAYTRELNRLLVRSLFGCGVVCGLVVKTDEGRCGKGSIIVEKGLALECDGDPIYVPKDQRIAIDANCELDDNEVWVVLCRTVKCCAPRTSMCASDEDETTSMCTREREGFEIRVLRDRPKCACECGPPKDEADEDRDALLEAEKEEQGEESCRCVSVNNRCYDAHYAGTCGCTCDDCAGGCCDCVLLARLERADGESPWTADHGVRRFVRPVLMRDPVATAERTARQANLAQGQAAMAMKVQAQGVAAAPQTGKSATKAKAAKSTRP